MAYGYPRKRSRYSRRTSYGSRRSSRSYSGGGRGRSGRATREIRLVIQTPSDMLPARPKVGQFARARRRARF